MEQLALSEIEERVLKGFIQQVTHLYPEQIISIELFGSKARGDDHYESDIDLLIIVRDRQQINRNELYDFVIDAELNYGIDISLKVYNKDDFDKLVELNVPFASNIQKEGVTLWTT